MRCPGDPSAKRQDDGITPALAPLLCAGLIGWRSLVAAGSDGNIGIFGFGAAAHILTQVCTWQGRRWIGTA